MFEASQHLAWMHMIAPENLLRSEAHGQIHPSNLILARSDMCICINMPKVSHIRHSHTESSYAGHTSGYVLLNHLSASMTGWYVLFVSYFVNHDRLHVIAFRCYDLISASIQANICRADLHNIISWQSWKKIMWAVGFTNHQRLGETNAPCSGQATTSFAW